MFTGLISDVGTVLERDGSKVVIGCSYDPASIDIGASIACDGCCLTVTAVEAGKEGGAVFHVEVSNETFDCTTLGSWQEGQGINLERSLALGAELGGHIVTGHVDGVGDIVALRADGDSKRFTFEVPDELAAFIASKGSVALNGTSLTVNEVEKNRFGVNIIPHTLQVTTWGGMEAGAKVNVEVDLLARYVARLHEFGKA